MDRPWPDLLDRLVDRPDTRACRYLVVAFATDKAKYVDVWERTLTNATGDVDGETAHAKIKQWKDGAFKMEKGNIWRGDTTGQSMVTSIRPHVESIVTEKAPDLLACDEEAWVEAAGDFRPYMAAVAKTVAPGQTVAAVERRRILTGIRPHMEAKPAGNSRKGTSKKKGEGD